MIVAPFGRFTEGRVPDPGIAALFTRENRWQARLDVEAALALAEADAGVIPKESARAIALTARIEKLDIKRVLAGTAEASHPLVPLIEEFARVVGSKHGGWVHWGATTQNITQTADVLVLRDAHRVLLRQLGGTLRAAAALAEGAADLPMAGRTHSQHAVPVTFGFKVAVWIDQLVAHTERLERLDDRLFCVLMGGAAGTFASFGDAGRVIEAGVAQRLSLHPMRVPSRSVNDGIVELVLVLAQLAGTIGKIGRDVYALMQPEFAEAFEPVPEGTVGSSTMPHKRNPQLALDLLTMSSELRALATPALESMLHDQEANGAMTALLEDVSASAAVLAGDMLARLQVILAGLELDPARMRENIKLSEGMIGSEALMLALGEKIGRQKAHDVVFEVAQAAATQDTPFLELLQADPLVGGSFAPDELHELVDPAGYLGLSAQIATELAECAISTADRLDRLPERAPVITR
ncbi:MULTISPECIES: adenylosuccinate lyase family protein [unclassified Isoptericola]|uniref:class-II fumarase/aspartase family protein n=1 Tax=unclassified Isoptericola TaxID=2623355 RepID=UPI0027143E93|nr:MULTISPECIES: adenylosuccinate lyase family protein [unclassified Isoptericola]MDO8143570.1 adenylosuccinate lyase family protein [Isoptericola sp. 178]MDO8147436.1 adenylosuccinate lyase family protein [Isoptericola sp. b515]MDO8150255.1 adenylosuccinate lyase family protein [Isoptericola sp. b408]